MIELFITDVVDQIGRTSSNSSGTVLDVTNEGIIINIGTESGAYRGLIYEVFRKGDPIRGPQRNDIIGYVPTYSGNIRLMKVFETFSLAFRITPFRLEPQRGDIVLKKEPVIRLALYPINDLTGRYTTFSRSLEEVLRYRLVQTGKYELASENTIERLPPDSRDIKELLRYVCP